MFEFNYNLTNDSTFKTWFKCYFNVFENDADALDNATKTRSLVSKINKDYYNQHILDNKKQVYLCFYYRTIVKMLRKIIIF